MNRRTFIHTAGTSLAMAALAGAAHNARAANEEERKKAPAVREAKRVPRFGDGRDWFFERRYGLFMHWGIYAINGYHEQEQWRLRIPRAEYVKLVDRWNPVKFNPDAWLDLMEEAGMSYLCLTSKHHDGFCLWDTKFTKYNTMNTPYGKDIIGMLAKACQRRKVPLVLYYSIADWHQPNYPNQGRHHELPPQPGDQPNYAKYLDFARGQIRELCTNYGEIHGIWWDMNVEEHRDSSFSKMIRELQPKAVINNRGFDEGDYGTDEYDWDRGGGEPIGFTKRTQACQSVDTESWGWRKNEDYYTDRYFLRCLDKYLARDGNFLLNVGPKPDGTIGDDPAGILRRIGKWYATMRESLDDVVPASHYTANRDILLTQRGKTLYVHMHTEPLAAMVKLAPINKLPLRATLLNNGAPVQCTNDLAPRDFESQQRSLRLRNLPVNELADTVMVVKLEFENEADFRAPQLGIG